MKKYLFLLLIPLLLITFKLALASEPALEWRIVGDTLILQLDPDSGVHCYPHATETRLYITDRNQEIYTQEVELGSRNEVDLLSLSGEFPYTATSCAGTLTYDGPENGGVAGDEAASVRVLTGWAWSSNIGWLSFNSSNAGAGTGSPYRVTFNNGVLGGYAWSPHIGYVSFNAGNTCPNAPGSCTAQVDTTTTGKVEGWIQALTLKNDGENSNGWIELSGVNHASPGGAGVKFSTTTGNFSGYAWGGVVGWLNFNGVACPDCVAVVVPPTVDPTLEATVTASPSSGAVPLASTLTASRTGGTATGKIAYRFKCGLSADEIWARSFLTQTDQYNCTYPQAGTYIASAQVTQESVVVTPTVTITVTGDNTSTNGVVFNIGPYDTTRIVAGVTTKLINAGDRFGLKWTIPTAQVNTCSASVAGPAGSNPSFAGFTNITVDNSSVYGAPSTETDLPKGRYTFTISCAGATPAQVFLDVARSTEVPI